MYQRGLEGTLPHVPFQVSGLTYDGLDQSFMTMTNSQRVSRLALEPCTNIWRRLWKSEQKVMQTLAPDNKDKQARDKLSNLPVVHHVATGLVRGP